MSARLVALVKERPKWLSEVAEELAQLAQQADAVGLSQALHRAAEEHSERVADLTAAIAIEWDRLGIVRIPKGISLGP